MRIYIYDLWSLCSVKLLWDLCRIPKILLCASGVTWREDYVRKLEDLWGDEWLESEILVVLSKKLAACCKSSQRKAVSKQSVSHFFLSWFKFCCWHNTPISLPWCTISNSNFSGNVSPRLRQLSFLDWVTFWFTPAVFRQQLLDYLD